MQKKYWLAALLVLAMVLAAGSLVLAENGTAEVTIHVKDTDGNSMADAEVTVWEHILGEGKGVQVGQQTTGGEGTVTFTLDRWSEYEAEAQKDELHAHTHINIHDEAEMDVTMYLFSHNERSVHFNVGGPLGVNLHIEDGCCHWIPMGEPPIRRWSPGAATPCRSTRSPTTASAPWR